MYSPEINTPISHPSDSPRSNMPADYSSGSPKKSGRPVLVVCGPTASGKTATAIQLCQALDGEVVSADSMQLYRGLDIGTAKATRVERAGIPHHLLDILEPGESFSVAAYKQKATAIILDIFARGRQPVVCGGTGQYISALIEGLTFIEMPTDLALRERLNHDADEKGLAVLWQAIQAKDPETAARISQQDRKRIVRALEVIAQTGLTPTEINRRSHDQGPDFDFRGYCLTHDRPVLYNRINQRVLEMFAAGLEEEVRQLLDRGLAPNSTCLQAIGYKEMIACLNGQISRDEAIAAVAQATRRYAKRQLTWFRRMPGLHWLENLSPAEATARILAEYEQYLQG